MKTMIPNPAAQKYRILIVSIVTLTVGVIVPQRSPTSAGEQQNVIHQLRIYEYLIAIKKRFMTAFEITLCKSWRDMILR
jgi:hypothetical protein